MALNGPELCRMTFNTAKEGLIFQMVNGMNGPECCDCCEWLLNPPFELDQEAPHSTVWSCEVGLDQQR